MGSIEYSYSQLIDYFYKERSEGLRDRIFRYKFIAYFLLFIYLQGNFAANNIKTGNPGYDVAFKYNNKLIKTDNNLVYIGGTQNYLFLRERKSKSNIIFRIDKIDSCSIKKVEYEYSFSFSKN